MKSMDLQCSESVVPFKASESDWQSQKTLARYERCKFCLYYVNMLYFIVKARGLYYNTFYGRNCSRIVKS